MRPGLIDRQSRVHGFSGRNPGDESLEAHAAGKEGNLMSFDPIVLTSTTDSTRTTMPHIEPKTTAYRNKTWRDAEGQRETAVRLERLPPNLLFPEDFPEPITYDPGRHQ